LSRCATSYAALRLDTFSLRPFEEALATSGGLLGTIMDASGHLTLTPDAQEAVVELSTRCSHALPHALQRAVAGIYDPASSPIVLVEGVPMPPELPAVSSPYLDAASSAVAAALAPSLAVQAAIGSLAGGQFTFYGERGANLFHLCLPLRGVPDTSQSSIGAAAINLHTEDPIAPIDRLQPRALSLMMLRAERAPASSSRTVLASVDAIAADLLEPEHGGKLATLCEARFEHPVPDVFQLLSFDGGAPSASAAERAQPVLYERDGLACILLQEYSCPIDADDGEAVEAMSWLRELLHARAATLQLSPGDVLLWANQRVAHGRCGAINSPAFDGFDRLLARTFHHPQPPATVVR